MTCHHPLLLPDPDLSFNCWGGNPCYLVLSSRFNETIGFVDNDSMKCLSSKPHMVVPWWPFCTGIKKLKLKCTTTSHYIQHYPHPNTLLFCKFHLSGGAHRLDHNDHPNVQALSLSDWLLRSYWPYWEPDNHNPSEISCWGHSDLSDSLRYHPHSEIILHLGWHWLFSTHWAVCNKWPPYTHPPFHPDACICSPQEG